MDSAQNIIIFEGPDGCGKTNIARALSTQLNIPYFKNENEWAFFENDPSYFINALTYGDPYFLSYLEQTGASVIADRWYPSEWVYSRAFSRPTNHDALESIDSRAAAMGAKIIIPHRTDYSGVIDQFESIITTDTLKSIHQLYQDFAKWTRCPTYFLNVDDEVLVRELFEITSFLGD
jgi:thymidylate kinase